jgi:hypothetical protein
MLIENQHRIVVKEQVQTRQTDFRTDGLPRYMGQRRYSWKSEEIVVGKYREGTLMIDLVDAVNNKMVWQGGSDRYHSCKEYQLQVEMNQVVKEIIDKIPR